MKGILEGEVEGQPGEALMGCLGSNERFQRRCRGGNDGGGVGGGEMLMVERC